MLYTVNSSYIKGKSDMDIIKTIEETMRRIDIADYSNIVIATSNMIDGIEYLSSVEGLDLPYAISKEYLSNNTTYIFIYTNKEVKDDHIYVIPDNDEKISYKLYDYKMYFVEDTLPL